MTKDPLEDAVVRLTQVVKDLQRIRMNRKLDEYPDGHPEEPAELRKFREQNPDWKHTANFRDYQD